MCTHGELSHSFITFMQESLSRYESERGTAGRGTPPEKKEGQPRLDLLLQQTYIYQVWSFSNTQHYPLQHMLDIMCINSRIMVRENKCQHKIRDLMQLYFYVYILRVKLFLQERKAILEINKERKLSSLQSAQIPGQRIIVSVQRVHYRRWYGTNNRLHSIPRSYTRLSGAEEISGTK